MEQFLGEGFQTIAEATEKTGIAGFYENHPWPTYIGTGVLGLTIARLFGK